MTQTIHTDAFNVSTRGKRPAGLVWVVFAFCAVAVVVSSYGLITSLRHSAILQTQVQDLSTEQARLDMIAVKQKAALRSAPAKALAKAEQDLQSLSGVNWDAVLDALEMAAADVHGGVTILSLGTTRAQMENVELNVTALANSSQSMLAYVQHLNEEAIAVNVDITHQQPDSQVAAQGYKFQMVAIFNPSRATSHPERPLPLPASLNKDLPTNKLPAPAVLVRTPMPPNASAK